MLTLRLEAYLDQVQRWPQAGRQILAQFDRDAVVVYQAYRRAIGHYAATHHRFGGEFRFTRMSWIKSNFLWMMYRSGWGTKPDQEVTLAIWLRRTLFDEILEAAVPSTFVPEVYESESEWQQAVAHSSVRLQWDPDHDPSGAKVARRALQLGLRGEVLARYARDSMLHIEDISPFVREQFRNAQSLTCYESLLLPREEVYPLADLSSSLAARLGLFPIP